MNTTWVRSAALAAGLAVAAAAPGAAWAQEKIRIAGNFSDKHSSSIAIEPTTGPAGAADFHIHDSPAAAGSPLWLPDARMSNAPG